MLERLYWTTKDKKKIRISKMEDSHLINTLNFLNRRKERGVIVFTGDSFFEIHLIENPKIWKQLIKEANRRGLKIISDQEIKDSMRPL